MIELKNLSAGYPAKPVLQDISLSVLRGELISVIGKNGSGKSTLLKTAVGSIPAKGGEILIDGTPSASLSRQDRAKKIAYLAQGKSIADMTVRQMVLHGRFPHLS